MTNDKILMGLKCSEQALRETAPQFSAAVNQVIQALKCREEHSLEEAKAVFENLKGTCASIAVFNSEKLYIKNDQCEVSISIPGRMCRLSGAFGLDELEAITAWMRDPEGLVSAGKGGKLK